MFCQVNLIGKLWNKSPSMFLKQANNQANLSGGSLQVFYCTDKCGTGLGNSPQAGQGLSFPWTWHQSWEKRAAHPSQPRDGAGYVQLLVEKIEGRKKPKTTKKVPSLTSTMSTNLEMLMVSFGNVILTGCSKRDPFLRTWGAWRPSPTFLIRWDSGPALVGYQPPAVQRRHQDMAGAWTCLSPSGSSLQHCLALGIPGQSLGQERNPCIPLVTDTNLPTGLCKGQPWELLSQETSLGILRLCLGKFSFYSSAIKTKLGSFHTYLRAVVSFPTIFVLSNNLGMWHFVQYFTEVKIIDLIS